MFSTVTGTSPDDTMAKLSSRTLPTSVQDTYFRIGFNQYSRIGHGAIEVQMIVVSWLIGFNNSLGGFTLRCGLVFNNNFHPFIGRKFCQWTRYDERKRTLSRDINIIDDKICFTIISNTQRFGTRISCGTGPKSISSGSRRMFGNSVIIGSCLTCSYSEQWSPKGR